MTFSSIFYIKKCNIDVTAQNEFAPVYGYFPDVKVPYMVINGEEISSSAQVCIEYLAWKFGKDFSSHLSPMENATARAFQAMCEDHLYW